LIRTCAFMDDDQLIYDIPINQLKQKNIKWYWVDFLKPTKEEVSWLSKAFKFHPLAVEDSLDEFIQRPKLDFYDQYTFLVLHAIHQESLSPYEVDVFVSEQFIVTFQQNTIRDVNNLWDKLKKDESIRRGPFFVLHAIIDKLVDDYFPPVYKIEEQLNAIEDNNNNEFVQVLIEKLFDIRSDLSKLRRTILPMSDLLYRIIHSERLNHLREHKLYFYDVHDHLIKLVEMLESYRDFSSDIRDSYLSVNSNTMNSIMMTLTVITTIFMPLTFIAGIYGMNFEHMPELHWKYGYFIILGFMGTVAILMFYLFRAKGWFKLGRVKQRKKRRIHLR
jgi:magnesium transporter